MLNNREWASVIWLLALAPWLLSKSHVRSSLRGVLRAFANRMIIVTIAAMTMYVSGLGFVARRFQLWTGLSTKDTVIWFVVVAGPLWLRVSASARRGYFRKAALDAVGVSVLLGFFLNLFVFSLWGELLLVPIVFFAVCIPIVARADPNSASAVHVANGVSAIVGLTAAAYCTWKLVTDWQEVANGQTFRSLALPVWLTLGLLPFLYLLSLYVNYETTFALMKLAGGDRHSLRRAKLALVVTLGLRTSAAGSFRWPWIGNLLDSDSWHEARRLVQAYRSRWRLSASDDDEDDDEDDEPGK